MKIQAILVVLLANLTACKKFPVAETSRPNMATLAPSPASPSPEPSPRIVTAGSPIAAYFAESCAPQCHDQRALTDRWTKRLFNTDGTVIFTDVTSTDNAMVPPRTEADRRAIINGVKEPPRTEADRVRAIINVFDENLDITDSRKFDMRRTVRARKLGMEPAQRQMVRTWIESQLHLYTDWYEETYSVEVDPKQSPVLTAEPTSSIVDETTAGVASGSPISQFFVARCVSCHSDDHRTPWLRLFHERGTLIHEEVTSTNANQLRRSALQRARAIVAILAETHPGDQRRMIVIARETRASMTTEERRTFAAWANQIAPTFLDGIRP